MGMYIEGLDGHSCEGLTRLVVGLRSGLGRIWVSKGMVVGF